MKKIISLVMSMVLAMALLAGCGSKTPTNTNTGKTPDTKVEDTVKTGLAVTTSVAKSADAGEKDGLAEADSIIAAVTVDKDGKIVKAILDAAQTKINFSKEGKLLTDVKSTFKTKNELKEEYGMKSNSKIGKEWYEQADAFAKYVVGKTAAEVKGIAVTAEGLASDAELASSVTVHVGDFIATVAKAAENAQDLGAKAADKLGLGVSTDIAKSTDAGEKDGLAQAYSYYTASTFDASGKITSSIIDASQANVNFSTTGKITSDITAALPTKNELGDAYGMKKQSKIGKEWNEQANAFAKYVVGKTVDEVKGIALTAEGVPSGTDLNSSVTVHVSSFQSIIEKASNYAQ
ncbi:MAG: hypothetical protein K0R09_3279 [Clostridiales bacterium]|jgi:predicted small lipoprotein YifL|nr:hypothetical protein [Clostridiales bacterium]